MTRSTFRRVEWSHIVYEITTITNSLLECIHVHLNRMFRFIETTDSLGISFFSSEIGVYVVISFPSPSHPVPHRAVNHDATFGMEPHYFSYSLTIRLWTRGGDSEAEEEPLSGSSPLSWWFAAEGSALLR